MAQIPPPQSLLLAAQTIGDGVLLCLMLTGPAACRTLLMVRRNLDRPAGRRPAASHDNYNTGPKHAYGLTVCLRRFLLRLLYKLSSYFSSSYFSSVA